MCAGHKYLDVSHAPQTRISSSEPQSIHAECSIFHQRIHVRNLVFLTLFLFRGHIQSVTKTKRFYYLTFLKSLLSETSMLPKFNSWKQASYILPKSSFSRNILLQPLKQYPTSAQHTETWLNPGVDPEILEECIDSPLQEIYPNITSWAEIFDRVYSLKSTCSKPHNSLSLSNRQLSADWARKAALRERLCLCFKMNRESVCGSGQVSIQEIVFNLFKCQNKCVVKGSEFSTL